MHEPTCNYRRSIAVFAALAASIAAQPAAAAEISVDPACSDPGCYATVQEGVDAAADGDTVVIAPGVYDEVVEITARSGLTIQGEGATLRPSPANHPGFPGADHRGRPTANNCGVPGGYAGLLRVEDSSAISIVGLTVDGVHGGFSDSLPHSHGILFLNTTDSSVTGAKVVNVNLNTPRNGGFSIAIGASKGSASSVNISNSEILDYGSGGIRFGGCGGCAGSSNVTGSVVDTKIESAIQDTRHVGIQVSGGAGPVEMTGNRIIYNAGEGFSSGILIVDSNGNRIGENEIAANQTGIRLHRSAKCSPESVKDNRISCNEFLVNAVGVGTNATLNRAYDNNFQANHVGAEATNGNTVAGVASPRGGELRVSTREFDAANNWWSSVDGPRSEGGSAAPGSGDGVRGEVRFAPFLTRKSTCSAQAAISVDEQCFDAPGCPNWYDQFRSGERQLSSGATTIGNIITGNITRPIVEGVIEGCSDDERCRNALLMALGIKNDPGSATGALGGLTGGLPVGPIVEPAVYDACRELGFGHPPCEHIARWASLGSQSPGEWSAMPGWIKCENYDPPADPLDAFWAFCPG